MPIKTNQANSKFNGDVPHRPKNEVPCRHSHPCLVDAHPSPYTFVMRCEGEQWPQPGIARNWTAQKPCAKESNVCPRQVSRCRLNAFSFALLFVPYVCVLRGAFICCADPFQCLCNSTTLVSCSPTLFLINTARWARRIRRFPRNYHLVRDLNQVLALRDRSVIVGCFVFRRAVMLFFGTGSGLQRPPAAMRVAR